jgi:hypothetical protein
LVAPAVAWVMALFLYRAVELGPPGPLPSMRTGSEGTCHFGCGRSLEGGESSAGCVTLMRHCSWVENGPDERLPSLSIAYQPALMPRISDLSSLMKWGMAIVVLPVLDHQSNRPDRA